MQEGSGTVHGLGARNRHYPSVLNVRPHFFFFFKKILIVPGGVDIVFGFFFLGLSLLLPHKPNIGY